MTQTPTESSFAGLGNLKIAYRSWRPAAAPRGVVMIAPGFNAHSGHYLGVGAELAERGLAVYAIDHRGRGMSDGERYYVDSFDDYVADLHTLVGRAKAADPGLPVFLLGHSAGGVVACGYVLAHPGELAGLICESFAFRVPAPDFALAVLKGLSHVAPHAHVLKLKNEDFSRDPAWVATMNADPLIAHEVQPTQTVAEMVRADERIEAGFAAITLPVLILHGTADKATVCQGSEYFHAHAGSADKTLKLYKDHVHDLLNDLGKEEVMADILGWLDTRLAARVAA
jgi:acylglycerol lipase